MKRVFVLLVIFTSLLLRVQAQTPAEWQQDLRFLQQTVHTKYANLFYNITAADWDKAVDKLYNEIPTLNPQATLVGMMKLVALFHVGHTQVSTRSFHDPNRSVISLGRYPFQLYWFSDGVYIISADKNYEAAVGGKVLQIGNMKTADALETIRPLVNYENEQGYKSNSMFFLAIPEFLQALGIASSGDQVPLLISKNGKESTVMFKAGNATFSNPTGLELPGSWVAAKKPGDTPLWQKDPAAYRYYEYLPDSKTLYVRHSVVLNDGNKTISDFFANIADFIDKNDVQRLVLDIRMNGGGNNYLNKSVINTIVAARKINQKGKFFCILGRRTFSAAQNLTNELEKYTEVTFVGEPTGENVNFYGDTRTEVLPNSKLPVNLSWLWWQNLDPRDTRKATSPQLAADMSFSDYYNNQDPAMDVILHYNIAKDLFPNLTNLAQSGKKEEAYQFAAAYYKDPVNRYGLDKMESDINTEGYRLLSAGNNQTASNLLEVNMKLFPESANTYDSYAESLAALGKTDEAIKYYEMAIAKDKEGTTAQNSKTQLEKLKNKKSF